MTDTANESMTAAEYREQQAESGKRVGAKSAVAVDPGKTTGVAVKHTDGRLVTHTTDFWDLNRATIDKRWMELVPWIVECPQSTRFGVHGPDTRRQVYNSGGVAREAALLVEGLKRRGYDVVEHDPKDQGQKWDAQTLRGIVGDWQGPDQEDVRDALRLLVWYDVI